MNLQQTVSANQSQTQKQKFAMTQQLQQSIQILNYNTDDLNHFVMDMAMENPFMEVQSGFQEQVIARTRKASQDGDLQQFINQLPDKEESLYHSLNEQIHLCYRDTPIRQKMFQLVHLLDSNGYLTVPLSALATEEAPEVMWLDALTLLQQLEPAGVGARNLQECLLLQIERDDYAPDIAYLVIEDAFEDFTQRKWQNIAGKYGVSLSDIQAVFDYVLTLTPHPGSMRQTSNEMIIVPDLTARLENGQWMIQSNKGGMPQVTMDDRYYQSMLNTGEKEVQQYAESKKNEIQWLEKSLHRRSDTILAVGKAIMQVQSSFFSEENHPIAPLSLQDIAQQLKIHESTVSRAVNGKYLETPFGTYELRSFFNSQTNRAGELIEVDKIKKRIQQLVNDEDKKKPLSDQKIVTKLKEEGFNISRRTVAKYREELNILSSTKRKRFD